MEQILYSFLVFSGAVMCYPHITTQRSTERSKSIYGASVTTKPLEGTDRGLYNSVLFEGDIVLTPTQENETMQRNAVIESTKLWPYGAVVYTIDPSVGCPNSLQCALLAKALDHLHEQGCVRFKQWSGESYRINIFVNPVSDECWSPVGRTGASEQPLSLGSSCWHQGIVLHELLHATGFWHEMNRPDRDQYVNVNWQNIMPGFSTAFYKQGHYEVNTLGEHFDYRSVMMYDEYAFSKDGVSVTLQPTVPGVYIGPIWKKNELSESDVRRLHKLYSCQGNRNLPGFPYDILCTFDGNSCGFKNGDSKQWKWRRTTDSDGFLTTYLPSSQLSPGYLQSSTFHTTDVTELGCVQFSYFVDSDTNSSYLRSMGYISQLLHAYLEKPTKVNFNPETTYELWSSDQISDSWRHVQIPLYVTRPFKLLFESFFAANAKTGTIAIDNVELLYSSCPQTATSFTKNRQAEHTSNNSELQIFDIDI